MKIIMYVLIAVAVIYFFALILTSYKKTKDFFNKRYTNFHTHTEFCDGSSPMEEIVESAINVGMPILGFSAHSHLDSEPEWSLSIEGEKEYQKKVLELKEKYKERIDIRLGIEQDYWSDSSDLSAYDFVIGAVHSLNGDDTTWSSVDYTHENFLRGVDNYFGGDREAAAVRYFELVGDLYEMTKCDIIGHFDLIKRFNEESIKETGKPFVNLDDPRVVEAERKAFEKLVATPVIFEINTGGIARGYMSEPYPSRRILKLLSEKKTPVILASDCHNKDYLTTGFDEAMELVKEYDLNIVFDYKK